MRVTITPLSTYPGACAIQARLYNKECAHARPSVARIQSFLCFGCCKMQGGRVRPTDAEQPRECSQDGRFYRRLLQVHRELPHPQPCRGFGSLRPPSAFISIL